MKRTLIVILGLSLLVSCHNKGQENDIDNYAWYDSVFTNAVYDTTTIIPDYTFSTDWMQRYVQYVKENYGNVEDMMFSKDTTESFDCRLWTLAYVDGDTIPELLLYGGCWASGEIILSQYGGKVYASPTGYYYYIKGADGLLHSLWMHMHEVWGEVYKMKNGKFTEIADYYCHTDLVDTNEVGNYGLTLDTLRSTYANGEIGDTMVIVSSIELDGKLLGAFFGFCYPCCRGFDKFRQTMDALYYSKGTSTYFPTTGRSVEELFKQR